MTTTSTLTDRYVWAVQRSLPESQRADIDRELRGAIADTIDGKRQNGLDEQAAERETLDELGDPFRLAAGYADRPLHLIGPDLFPTYVRLLKLLYAIVLPTTAGAVLLALLLSRPDSVGEVVGPFWATIMGVTVHLGFWVTLVFAFIERGSRSNTGVFEPWTPDKLPELPQRGEVKLGETLGSVAFLIVMIGFAFWQQLWPVVTADDGTPLPALNESLWSLWLPVLFGIAALEIGFAFLLYRVGRWTVPLAVINAVLSVAAAVILVWLFTTDQFFDPRWAAELNLTELVAPGGIVATIGAITGVGVAAWDIIDGAIKTWRHRNA